jgi:hypothetical protein
MKPVPQARLTGDDIMTTSRLFSCLIHAAALAGLLLVTSATHPATAGPRGVKSTSTGTNKESSTVGHRDRIIRDHRGVTRTYRGRPICAGWAC